MTKRQPRRAPADEPYRLGDLMIMFGYHDEDSFRAWRKRAEAMGFPQPIIGCTRPLKWSRELVDAWCAANGRPAQAALQDVKRAAGEEAPPLDELARHRMVLQMRAAQRGAA